MLCVSVRAAAAQPAGLQNGTRTDANTSSQPSPGAAHGDEGGAHPGPGATHDADDATTRAIQLLLYATSTIIGVVAVQVRAR